jgi:hypothetical protein
MKLGKLKQNTQLHLSGGHGRVVVPAGTLVKVCWKSLKRGIVFYRYIYRDGKEVKVPTRALTRVQVLQFIGYEWLGYFIRNPDDGKIYQVFEEDGEPAGWVLFPEGGEPYPFTMLPRNSNTTR